MSNPSKKSIPSWQKDSDIATGSTTPPQTADSTATPSHAELLEQAREFLNQESIKSAPRERKVAFLREKGLKLEDIQILLDIKPDNEPEDIDNLKTVHDTSTSSIDTPESETPSQVPAFNDAPLKAQPHPRDVPPIITYPEFLLKPQKPPPLVTFDRLAKAGYAFAMISALTYGASKYMVEPMLESLSSARHDLADATLQDLEKLNTKLETSVSHIPYIASKAALKSHHNDNDDDGTESVDSDPSELFHRDIATQTTPSLSRSSSTSSLTKKSPPNTTTQQISKLESLQDTLKSLVESTDPSTRPFAPVDPSKRLAESVTQFQAVLDKLENTYNPFRADYTNIYSPSIPDPKKGKTDNNEAAKFKAEIRNLKGAFLSSRNFPTARPTTPGGYRPR